MHHSLLTAVTDLQDEIIDLERVTLNGASSAVNTPVDVRDWSAEELFAAAQATHLASLAAADVEAEFLAGACHPTPPLASSVFVSVAFPLLGCCRWPACVANMSACVMWAWMAASMGNAPPQAAVHLHTLLIDACTSIQAHTYTCACTFPPCLPKNLLAALHTPPPTHNTQAQATQTQAATSPPCRQRLMGW